MLWWKSTRAVDVIGGVGAPIWGQKWAQNDQKLGQIVFWLVIVKNDESFWTILILSYVTGMKGSESYKSREQKYVYAL